ncbi:MAG: FHA domain-containing protein [Planctomycetota bacterium]|nr:MAG: FHA domain-containing protein [Planctomycetota bacterium]
MEKITVYKDNQPIEEIPLTTEANAQYRFGRSLENEIIVQDQKASRHHCLLLKREGKYFIKDLGSTNGTFLNEKQLPPQVETPLQNGDVARIGSHHYHFTLPSLSLTMVGQEAVQPSLTDKELPPTLVDPEAIDFSFEEFFQEMGAHLLISYEGKRELYALEQKEITIGRSDENDIVISHSSISGHHAVFRLIGSCFELEDLRSTNGTVVNGQLIHKTRLSSPSLISFGDAVCLYTTKEANTKKHREQLEKTAKLLLKAGLINKKKWKQILSDPNLTLRDLGEDLILNNVLTIVLWHKILIGETKILEEASSTKIEKKLFLALTLFFLLLGTLFVGLYLIKNADNSIRNLYQKARNEWKLTKKEPLRAEDHFQSSLQAFDKALKNIKITLIKESIQSLLSEETTSQLKKKIEQEKAKMTLDYAKFLISKGRAKEAIKILSFLFQKSKKKKTKTALFREAVLLINNHYWKEFQKLERSQTSLQNKAKALIPIVYPEDTDELTNYYSSKDIEHFLVYKKSLRKLAQIYISLALEYLIQEKINATENLCNQANSLLAKLPPSTDPKKEIIQCISLACEIYRQSQDHGVPELKQKAVKQFQKIWQKIQPKLSAIPQKEFRAALERMHRFVQQFLRKPS